MNFLRTVLGLHRHHKGEQHIEGFGARDIGWIGSSTLVCNNIIGPGLFQLPGLFQQSGWVPCMVVLTATAVWTTQCALYLSRTMASFAENRDFSKRLEMSRVAFELLPRWGYYLMVFTLCTTFYTQNLANIILSAQSMDLAMLDILKNWGKPACAFDYTTFKPVCIADVSDGTSDSIFGDAFVISPGYAIVLIVCIPLSIMNLDDNIGIQIGGFLLTLGCMGTWLANFIAIGLQPSIMPMFGSGASDFLPLLPTILFNYGFVATIPSWLNEKAPGVSVNATILLAQAMATVQLLILAIFGGLSISIGDSSLSITAIMNGNSVDGVWHASRIMTFIFPIANIVTSIPVFCIIIRYNLLQFHGFKFPVWLANLFAVVSPWFVALPFFPGNSLSLVINWSSALLFVTMNMLLPLWMYLAQEHRKHSGLPPIVLRDDEQGGAVAEYDDEYHSHLLGTTGSDSEPVAAQGYGLAYLLAAEREAEDALLAEAAAAQKKGGGGSKGGSARVVVRDTGAVNRRAGDVQGRLLDDYDGAPEGDAAASSSAGWGEDVGIHALPGCCRAWRYSEWAYARGLLGVGLALALASLALQILSVADPNLSR